VGLSPLTCLPSKGNCPIRTPKIKIRTILKKEWHGMRSNRSGSATISLYIKIAVYTLYMAISYPFHFICNNWNNRH